MSDSIQLAKGVEIGGGELPLIAGPCALENEQLAITVAQWLAQLSRRLGIAAIFKSSFDKANRSSLASYRGPGLEEGLIILGKVRQATGLPVVTDVHLPSQCSAVAEVCDLLQIPAFLCRQTDLVVAAAETGRPIAIKKGQFMAPQDMVRIVDKARSTGNDRVVVIERGYCFGYNNLVVDMRSFAMLHAAGVRVIYDSTHSLQLPGGGETTGGARQYTEPLARAAVAAGADGIFMEVHPNPEAALSDATTQLPPQRATALVESLLDLYRLIHAESNDVVSAEVSR